MADLNGDGRAELLLGAVGNDAGGLDAGAAYVVFGKSTSTEVNLATLGSGGFRIRGVVGEGLGSTLTGLGDVNGDGTADLLLGTANGGKAYVVFGRSTTSEVNLATLGSGGYAIRAEAAGDLTGMVVTAAGDLNGDGVADLLIGAPHNAEGGANAGAVYAVWGGDTRDIDLALVAEGIGGAKIVGTAGSLTGSAVALLPDMNGDGRADLFIGSATSARVVFNPVSWQPDSNIYGSNAADSMGAGYGGLHRIGAGADAVYGLGGDDSIDAGAGNDSLDGGTGADTMAGGSGDDLYVLDSAADQVVEAAGEGSDTVQAGVTYTLGAELEALVLTGTAHQGTGNTGANSLTGNAGDDTLLGDAGNDTLLGLGGADLLDGGTGADSMAGGTDNDTYVVDEAGDLVSEAAGEGNDTVEASVDTVLAENVEALVLLGSALVEDFLGHDTLDASEATGDAYLDLSGGTQSHAGGGDVSIGIGGSSAASLDLQFLQDLTGSFGDDIATVRGLVPQIVAAIQAVQPHASFGVSTFRDKAFGAFGNAGDWVYNQQLALTTDTLALTTAYNAMAAGNGADGPEAQIEALMQLALRAGEVGFHANAARFVVLFTDADFHQAGDGLAAGIAMANNGDAVLDGLPAGTGEDYPLVAQVRAALEAANIIPIFAVTAPVLASYEGLVTALGRGTAVTLTADSGNVLAALNAGLTAATSTVIEDATGGAGNDTLLGNAADNALAGNAGDDSLDGGDGADNLSGGAGNDHLSDGAGGATMAGGLGDDTYVVATGLEVVVEAAGEGTDTVLASIDHTLGDALEALVLTRPGHHGTGNALDNSVQASSGDNTLEGLDGSDSLLGADGNDSLDGGTGADSMAGGLGNDLYLVDNAADIASEAAGAGTDTVYAGVDYSLGGNVEALVLLGTGHAGTGNELANSLTGTAGDDVLSGLDGNDTLDGGTGNDALVGGNGDDLYLVDSLGDVITEASKTGGLDTVVANLDWTLGANLENLVLSGLALTGTGNTLANRLSANDLGDSLNGGSGNDTLLGGAGNDVLNGSLGADSMAGGAGNDTYLVDNLADLVLELPGGGADMVRSSVSFTLGADLESLVLSGTAAINGFGNGLANSLTGNAAANLLDGGTEADTISGGDGNDTLVGGAGVDRLTGGLGNDVFRFNNLAEAGDKVVDFASGVDWLEVSAAGFGGGLAAGLDVAATGWFVAGTKATAAHAQFIATGTALYWDADGTGAGAKALVATIGGLVSSDLHVIG